MHKANNFKSATKSKNYPNFYFLKCWSAVILTGQIVVFVSFRTRFTALNVSYGSEELNCTPELNLMQHEIFAGVKVCELGILDDIFAVMKDW